MGKGILNMEPVRRDLVEDFVGRVTSKGETMPPLIMVGTDGVPLWAQPFMLISFLAKGFVIKPPGFDSEFEITDFEVLDSYNFRVVRVRICGKPNEQAVNTSTQVTEPLSERESAISDSGEVPAAAERSRWQSLMNRLRGKR